MGHKGRFQPPRLSAAYGFSKETFTEGRGKEEEAPIPAARRDERDRGVLQIAVIRPC
jgi:hypothetical protein